MIQKSCRGATVSEAPTRMMNHMILSEFAERNPPIGTRVNACPLLTLLKLELCVKSINGLK